MRFGWLTLSHSPSADGDHAAIEEQLIEEFDRAFDRNSSGKKSGAWDDRWVWPIGFRGFSPLARRKVGKRLHGENCAELFGILEAESQTLITAFLLNG